MARRSSAHRKVQKLGKERDHYMCFICAQVSQNAEGHHLLFHSEQGPALIDNIITLCQACHRDYHAGRMPVNFYLNDIQ